MSSRITVTFMPRETQHQELQVYRIPCRTSGGLAANHVDDAGFTQHLHPLALSLSLFLLLSRS